MNILVISHEYPPVGGGGGRVVKDLCTGLTRKSHQIILITAHWDNLPTEEKVGGLTIKRLASGRKEPYRAGLIAMAKFVWKSFWYGLKIIQKWRPDIIHAHFAVPAGASAWALSSFTGMPYILTAHGGDVPGGAPEKTRNWFRFVLPFSKIIWKKAAAVVAVSPETRRLAQEHYPVNIAIIPNGIDLDEYRPFIAIEKNITTIIFIARFSPEKNAVIVPRVLSKLLKYEWRCVMVGDGQQMGQVQDLIKDYHLTDRISLTGWISPDQVKKKLVESHIFFMPSLREGMPMAGLQGLASGLAMVLSRIGSCPDLVEEGKNGFLINPGDQEGYCNALERLLTNPSLLKKCQHRSRELAEKFNLNHSISAYDQLYCQVIGHQKV